MTHFVHGMEQNNKNIHFYLMKNTTQFLTDYNSVANIVKTIENAL